MKNYSAKEIKNIVLIGAPGTGKTTLAEAMAFEGKVIDRRGSIEANNTLSDNTDIEHEYKRSIYSTILFTEFMDRKLNIIDCPGSDDFCGSLFSAFKVGDVGVFLFNAQNGWEVGSEIQARYARLLQKPVIGVVNQLDAEKASFEATVESIRASSRVKPVIVQYPVNQGPEFNAFIDVLLMKMYRFKDNDGHREELEIPAEELEKAQELNKELVEMAAEHDEALMELYFDKGTLTQDDIRSGLKIGVSKREVMPIFCTSGKRDIGTKRLMEFIINVAPGPLKAPNFLSTDGEEIAADETAPAVAFVFKSQVEQHIGEITYFRVIRGRIAEGTELVNTRTGNKEKVSQLFAVAGKNRIKVTELMAGDIGCTVKLKGTRTNDTLAAPSAPVTVEPIVFPEPRYRAAVKAKEQGDEEKLGKVLNDAKFEDPTILVEYSKELKQTIIQGQGEHHLNILRTRIEKENRKVLRDMVQQSNDLFYRSRERKYAVMPMLQKLQDSEIDTGHYYVQIVDYMNEVTKSLVHITRPSFEHIDNNHEGMTREQIDDLVRIGDDVEVIFNRINVMLRNHDFADIELILELRDELFESIAEAVKQQLRRIKNRETSTRASLLYLTILNETKTMVLQARNLVKSQRYFLEHTQLRPGK